MSSRVQNNEFNQLSISTELIENDDLLAFMSLLRFELLYKVYQNYRLDLAGRFFKLLLMDKL